MGRIERLSSDEQTLSADIKAGAEGSSLKLADYPVTSRWKDLYVEKRAHAKAQGAQRSIGSYSWNFQRLKKLGREKEGVRM